MLKINQETRHVKSCQIYIVNQSILFLRSCCWMMLMYFGRCQQGSGVVNCSKVIVGVVNEHAKQRVKFVVM